MKNPKCAPEEGPISPDYGKFATLPAWPALNN